MSQKYLDFTKHISRNYVYLMNLAIYEYEYYQKIHELVENIS